MASGHLCQFVGAADCNIVGDCQISQSHRFVSKYPLWEKLKNTGGLIRAPISWFPPQSLGEWHILLDRLLSQRDKHGDWDGLQSRNFHWRISINILTHSQWFLNNPWTSSTELCCFPNHPTLKYWQITVIFMISWRETDILGWWPWAPRMNVRRPVTVHELVGKLCSEKECCASLACLGLMCSEFSWVPFSI